MCDFSLQAVRSRPAVVGDELITHNFGTGSRGFAGVNDHHDTAVCVLPGTELAFAREVVAKHCQPSDTIHPATAIFRQINLDNLLTHHDCLEFADGSTAMLAYLAEGQRATVLQLPAAPKTAAEAEAQERVAVLG